MTDFVARLVSNECELESTPSVNDNSDYSDGYPDDSSMLFDESTCGYQPDCRHEIEVEESPEAFKECDVNATFTRGSVDAGRGLILKQPLVVVHLGDDGKGPAVQEVASEEEGGVCKICCPGCIGGNILGDRDTYWTCDGACSRSFHYDCVLYNESFATQCVRGGRGRCYHCTIGHSFGSVCKALERIDRGFYCDDCWGWSDSEKSTTENVAQVMSSDDEQMETTIIMTRKRKLVAMMFESREVVMETLSA